MDPSTSTTSPQLQFINSEAATWQQLTSAPGVDRTSYYITTDLDSASSALKLSPGDFEDGNHGNPDLIVGIHIQSSGTILIESLHHAQNVHLGRETKPNSRQIKLLLPRSKPPKERMLVLLDSDATIFVNSETILFKLGTPQPSLTIDEEDHIATEVEEEPHVWVQQSHPQELKRGGSDIVHSTPAIPDTITVEPRVHETPSVKSRFMDPHSAKVTLSRGGILRGDTFGDIIDRDGESTPRGNQEQEVKGRRLFDTSKKTSGFETMPRKENNNDPVTIAGSAEESEEEEEENRSLAEMIKRQFSESAMITSFGSAMDEAVREVTSPVVENEEGEGNLPDGENTHMSPIKRHGIPEGFLYEEHKKDTTPKQVYGKNKRRSALVPKEKQTAGKERRVSNGTASGAHNSEDESIKDTQANRKSPKHIQKTNSMDESEGEGTGVFPRRKGTITKDEDTVIDTTGDEDENLPPPRTQRGRKTVQSLPSTTSTTQDNVMEVEQSARGKEIVSIKKAEKAAEEQDEEPDVGGKEIEIPSTAKPTRGRTGAKKLSDVSQSVFSTTPEESSEESPKVPPGTKATGLTLTRKRQRSGDVHEGDENSSIPTTRERTAHSTIHVAEQPVSKRAKIKKTPAAKRWRKKGATPPLLESSEKLLDDTQYTIQVTQTQTLDQAETKDPETAKKDPQPAKKSSARKKKADLQPMGTDGGEEDKEEAAEGKTRTKDRYEGDAPKIVFSNSSLDGRKDIEKFLRANGGKKMQNVSAPGVNFLVVGPGELKRTPKLTVGVAMGKYVVEDQWLIDSKEIGYFLDPDEYIPYDPTHEKSWSFSLTAAISRGRKGLNCILKDYNIYITSSLLSQLKASGQEGALIEMLKAAGAETITKKSPKGKRENDEYAEQTLILGAEKGDSDVVALEKAGWAVYGTGIVAISVLRGKLDVGENFRIVVPEVETSQKAMRGRKGK